MKKAVKEMNLKKRERRNKHGNLHAQPFPFPQDNLENNL